MRRYLWRRDCSDHSSDVQSSVLLICGSLRFLIRGIGTDRCVDQTKNEISAGVESRLKSGRYQSQQISRFGDIG